MLTDSGILIILESTLYAALCVSLCSIAALVVQLFTLGNCQLYFDPASFQVNLKRHQCISFLLYITDEFVNFPSVKQQFARSCRVGVKDIALLVWAYMHIMQKHLALFYVGIAVFKVDFAKADGFHLGNSQNNNCFACDVYQHLLR